MIECLSAMTGAASTTSTTAVICDEGGNQTTTIYSGLTTSTTTTAVYNNAIPHINITVSEAKLAVEAMSDTELAELDSLLNNKEQELVSAKMEDSKVYQKTSQQ